MWWPSEDVPLLLAQENTRVLQGEYPDSCTTKIPAGASPSWIRGSHEVLVASVERERLREREREARAQMTYEAEQRGSQAELASSGPLFGELVRVNRSTTDKERQQIERKLGKFDDVKHLLAEQDVTNLFGIDGQPPPSPAPIVPLLGGSSNSSSSSTLASASVFKKPAVAQHRSSHHHHHHQNHQRGGFVKPADGKPAYVGRGFYPGQPMKHHNSSSGEFRASGMVPGKGPPLTSPTSTTATTTSVNSHHSSFAANRPVGTQETSTRPASHRNLSKLRLDNRDTVPASSCSNENNSSSKTVVANILDEMLSVARPPLSAIAATPRKEMESKFVYNPLLGKMESLVPRPPIDKASKQNALNSLLESPSSRAAFPSSVFKPGLGQAFGGFRCPAALSPPTHRNKSTSDTSSGTTLSVSTSTGSAPLKPVLPAHPCLEADLSLSDDSDEEDDDVTNRKSNTKKSAVQPSEKVDVTKESDSTSSSKTEMSPEDDRNMSSSSDSESDSCSDSDDSSSDSASPPSLPLPVVTEEEEKNRWSLSNFLPPSAHGNSTPAPQTPQACVNSEKSKTDDSDSSAEGGEAPRSHSSSSSDSEVEKPSSGRSVAATTIDSSDEERGVRPAYRRRSSSYHSSSDDSDPPPVKPVTGPAPANSTASNPNITVVGVVKPHQRKPPSPPVFQDRGRLPNPSQPDQFAYAQQRPEPLLAPTFQRTTPVPVKPAKPAAAAKTPRGRKPKSPAAEPAPPKKRGRKRTKMVEMMSDSEDEAPKAKPPERKRPGRPPNKRVNEDADWPIGRRKLPVPEKPASNVWGERERRRSSLRAQSMAIDTDSEEAEAPTAAVKPTARVMPAVKGGKRSHRDSDPPERDDDSPPKLDVEGINVQDKKKNDTLRKLFSRREEGRRQYGGGKGKGGKGKYGVIVIESETERKLLERALSPAQSMSPTPALHRAVPGMQRVEMAPPRTPPAPRFRPSPERHHRRLSRGTLDKDPCELDTTSNGTPTTPSAAIESPAMPTLPPLTYVGGKPSLKCKIDLSRIPYILTRKRADEVRTEPADMRPPDRVDRSPPRVDAPRADCAKRPYAHTPTVDADSGSGDSDAGEKHAAPPMRDYYPMANGIQPNDLSADHSSADESWNMSSCSSCPASPVPYSRNDKYAHKRSSKHHHASRKRRKARTEHSQRHSSLVDTVPQLMHVPGTNHERNAPDSIFGTYPQLHINDIVRPMMPTHHGIYYSYLEHKASEDINSESDNVSPNLYLMEAKRLKHAADIERDPVAQGMQYLEAILSFVLTGHVLERKAQMDTAFSMYSETLKLIVYISKKFRTISTNTPQSSIPNKIAILSLRCESILNLKLYMMRELEIKDVHTAVTDYFINKPAPVDGCLLGNHGMPNTHSPTPSPASSVGSHSSGYSSGSNGDRRAGASQCFVVPHAAHTALQKQHNFYTNLIASFNYWDEADKLILTGGNKDFFIELDRFCGPLTLHSSLKDLVHYVRVGIQRLKAIISHHNGIDGSSKISSV